MATIQTMLAAGSVSSPYFLDVRITKQLCRKTASVPVFNPAFTLVSYKQVGVVTSAAGEVTGYEYEAIVNVQGIVTYTPCGGCCCAKSQTINQQFAIPFFSATVPASVSIDSGTAMNALVGGSGCCGCSNVFVSDVPLNLSVGVSA